MIPTSHNILDVIILTEIFPLLSYCSICTVQIASNVFMVSKFQGIFFDRLMSGHT